MNYDMDAANEYFENQQGIANMRADYREAIPHYNEYACGCKEQTSYSSNYYYDHKCAECYRQAWGHE